MRFLFAMLFLSALPVYSQLPVAPLAGCALALREADSNLHSPFLLRFSSQMKEAGLGFSKKTIAVTVQHLVENTLEFYALLSEVGIPREGTFILGKEYSSCCGVRGKLGDRGYNVLPSRIPPVGMFKQAFHQDVAVAWGAVEKYLANHPEVEEILILDDGGRVLSHVPDSIQAKYRVAGVEMTRGGHFTEKWGSIPFPIALACSSYAKKEYSSPLIIDFVKNQMRSRLDQFLNPNHVYGVVGAGMMGFELVEALLALNVRVVVYDIAPPEHFKKLYGYTLVPSLKDLYEASDVVFGVTGKDHADGALDSLRPKDRTLVSISSEDREFGAFLRLPSAKRIGESIHDKVVVEDPRIGRAEILNGGYPVNFNPGGRTGLPTGHMDIHFAMAVIGGFQAMEAAREKQPTEKSTNRRIAISAIQQQEWSRYWLSTLSPQDFALIEGYARTPDLKDIIPNTLGTHSPSAIDALRVQPSTR